MKEQLIKELTKIYIKSYEHDKKGHDIYIKKTSFLKNLIKFIKQNF